MLECWMGGGICVWWGRLRGSEALFQFRGILLRSNVEVTLARALARGEEVGEMETQRR
jgi:hypothetical protein